MAVPKHLEEAAARLEEAAARVDRARAKEPTPEVLHEWLAALTDYTRAVCDMQTFNNESIHEKIHDLAGRAGVSAFPPRIAPRRST